MSSDLMINCENLVKIYKTDETEVLALQGLDLEVTKGELMAIIGNSGSGKSTLLNMLGGLDRPTAGKLSVAGRNLLKMTDRQLVDYKKNTVGFVWQNNARNLIPYLTALQNVEIPMIISGAAKRRQRALELIEMVGLKDRRNNKLAQLSGGEQQRVAIAISLANKPDLVLADEPTGAVDSKTANQIMDVFRTLNKELEVTIVIVTHDRALSKKVNRVVAIRDGRTSSEFIMKNEYLNEFEKLEGMSEEETHEEMVVVDRHGRLQIPQEYLERLVLKDGNKAKIFLSGDEVVIASPEE